MKRQKTTGLAPSAISGLSSFDHRVELRIGRLGQAFGLRDERRERLVVARGRKQARRRPHRLRRRPRRTPVPRADRDRRRGGCAARSRRRRATSRRSASAPACPRRPAGAGAGPGLRPRRRRGSSRARRRGTHWCALLELVGTLRGLVLREDALLAPVAAGDVDPPPLHEMAGQAARGIARSRARRLRSPDRAG